ncbi:Rha family transcriptional regulator [Clostridium ljungdahlii]|uniref:Phage regulatory protein Rha (Phage_pRha) n=1 Tax=Clostridium ljungdahlii (strain ATCC 55383 / DSM 13528 / PETC) TaxID=748727 RepID=D8GTA7_CLOLD|nr:Rha family transcriptional regulator [Clostridium ljungdahlii]ADK16706.1 putative phage regulatory protein [Clostridium ljungdahlii DSM 13528]OAA89418.1 Phage regulatory protein Rha (Phage_pRha) [Clostridium ljungdahlii DSM 13528]
MNNLVSKQNLTLDSREVAKMVGKDHKNLLRDINTYISQMKQANEDSSKLSTPINPTDYFIESLYVNSQNKTQPCYLLTKLGCEFVSNKLTGVKGTAFTAIYTKKFNDMEASINTGLDTSQLSPSLQMFSKIFESLANAELGQKKLQQGITEAKKEASEVKKEVQGIRDTITLSSTSWRKDTTALVNKIALNVGGYDHIKAIREESYKLLNERMGVDVKTRLTNKRRRMADEGICKSKRDKLTILDVIQDDKKLIEGYVAIIKEMAIKSGTS